MTALIYKAALPTYNSAEALNANAGESLLLNDAGTAYELEPGQSGAYVPGTDRLFVESDYNTDQTLVAGAVPVYTTLTFDAPIVDVGDSFEVGTKGIHVVAGTVVAGSLWIDVYPAPVADVGLTVLITELTGDGTGSQVRTHTWHWMTIKAGQAPYVGLPFNAVITEGNWLCVRARVFGGNLVVDSFGGMSIHRIA